MQLGSSLNYVARHGRRGGGAKYSFYPTTLTYRVKEVIYIRGGGLKFASNRPFDFKDGPCDLREHIAYIAIKVQTSEN